MKVYITGIAGFIGFHTAIKYAKAGHEVRGCDNFNDYYDPSLKRARTHILEAYGVTVEYRDLKAVYFPINTFRPDLVIHLAAMAGIRYSMDHPKMYIENNIMGSQCLIEACERFEVPNVIYASTSSVMNGQPLPWGEDEPLGSQLSPYGYTKAANEDQFNISKIPNVAGIRFFTVYGPFGRPDMALFKFTKNITEGKPITIFDNGNMFRDFTYIDDIVQGIHLVSQNMTHRDIYCLGNGKRVNLLDFVEAIENNVDKKAIIEFAEPHPADAKETWALTRKIEELGYKSTVDMEEGVFKFCNWYKGWYNTNLGANQ